MFCWYKYWFVSKTNRDGYSNQIAVVCIIYRAPNSRVITGSNNHGDLDLNSVVNRPVSGKLRQSVPASSQCDQFYYPCTWRTLYFNWWPYFKNHPVIVYPIECKQAING